MTASGRRLDRLADLEEERDFLLRSLDDLEREHAAGEVDDDEFATLHDDYTRRTAAVARRIEAGEATIAREATPSRKWWYLAGAAVLATVAGLTLAQFSGQRSPGGTITGDINASVRTRVAEAEQLFFTGDLDGAREIVDGVLADDRDLAEGLYLSARIHERQAEIEPALRELDQILADDPDHIDALTWRGWILVRIDPALRDEALASEGVDLHRLGLEALDRAIALEAPLPDPYLFRGLAARELEGDLEAAIVFYEQALEREPPPQMQQVISDTIEEMRAQLEAG